MFRKRQNLTCSLCSAASHLRFDITDYVKHIKIFHAHDPSFKVTCGIGGCQRTYSNFRTFVNHVSAADDEQPNDDFGSGECSFGGVSYQDLLFTNNNDSLSPREMMKNTVATFLLGLKEKFKLTQTSIQGIVDGISALNSQRISLLKSEVYKLLHQADFTGFEGLDECFEHHEHVFLGLETQYHQVKYYKEHFNLIEPLRVVLGEYRAWKGWGAKRKCVTEQDCLMYIPILETIQSLLNNSALLSEIENGHQSSSVSSDYCDGKAYKSHPLFGTDKKALQLFLYFDELETCNPLGSKVKIHKLGAFYFALGNISPKYRSRISSIQLVALVKSHYISCYGMDTVLKPIVEDIKKLERGVDIVIHGVQKTVRGALAVISADNLGSLALGGFKEAVLL
ncbi:uncharacterized protein [Dysidea avara]|uniref:uncharacterized protein isoform X2 n=1 Tax=Dysidea avara TaxID=196820 RepID=UPI00331C1554